MTSFALNSGANYFKTHSVFLTKSGQRSKNYELLEEHIPPLVRVCKQQPRPRLNILSVGSGSGETDVDILKIVKEELQKSEHGRHMKIFNRAIEPNEYSCGLYKAAIGSLPSPLDDQLTEFEIRQQKFEEYKESQQESVRFDLVHFIHSIYHVDVEEALVHCFEKELNAQGTIVCVVAGQDLLHWVTSRQSNQWHGKHEASERETYETAEKIIKIAKDNGWKYEIYTQDYSIDVTEVFDEESTEGNLLLDFLTHTLNFRERAEKQLVEETLQMIKDLTILKDGKRLGEKKDSLFLIYKCNS